MIRYGNVDQFEEIADAAYNWWLRKRPCDFTLKNHLNNPIVNCTTDAESALANAVARGVRTGVYPAQKGCI
jgi:hypothetical protein